MSSLPRFICLTPCRNEGWLIDNHLKAASRWADAIVVGDQMSDDDTREIVQAHGSKAILVDNTSQGYDEGERHRVVFEAARKLFPGERKILLAIDADEMLSANWRESPEWEKIKSLPPGSGIYAKWVNINPDCETWFPLGDHFIIGIVDDGKLCHSPGQFHVPRLLQDPSKPKLYLEDIRLLHFQYVDAARTESKRRAYHVQEWLVNPRRPIRLFRRLNPLRCVRAGEIEPLDPRWTDGFAGEGFDWCSTRKDGVYRWDKLVLDAIAAKGAPFFSRLDVWDADWPSLASTHGIAAEAKATHDPRSVIEKLVHRFLRASQPYMDALPIRFVQWILRPFGW
jgi:hypothetical protein